MTKSELALDAVRRFPLFGRMAVHAWSAYELRAARKPHWAFTAMKAQSGVRIRRPFRLPDGQKLFADPFESVGAELRATNRYEPDVVSTLSALIRPGMVAADVGANIGCHTLTLARLVGEAGIVHAFEPEPSVFAELVRHVALNKWKNVRCQNTALSIESGETTLYLGSNDGTNSLRPTLHSGNKTTTVKTDTLDAYMQRHNLHRLDVVKIDVEGAERFVLRGGIATIERFRPILIVELSIHSAAFGYSDVQLRDELEGLGYCLYTTGAPPFLPYGRRGLDGDIFRNVLAIDPESPHFAQSYPSAGHTDA